MIWNLCTVKGITNWICDHSVKDGYKQKSTMGAEPRKGILWQVGYLHGLKVSPYSLLVGCKGRQTGTLQWRHMTLDQGSTCTSPTGDVAGHSVSTWAGITRENLCRGWIGMHNWISSWRNTNANGSHSILRLGVGWGEAVVFKNTKVTEHKERRIISD